MSGRPFTVGRFGTREAFVAEVKRLHDVGGYTISAIAWILEVNWRTVSKALNETTAG